jgi:hypothetical protein
MFLGRYETPFARNFLTKSAQVCLKDLLPSSTRPRVRPAGRTKKEAGLSPGLRVTHEFLSLLS